MGLSVRVWAGARWWMECAYVCSPVDCETGRGWSPSISPSRSTTLLHSFFASLPQGQTCHVAGAHSLTPPNPPDLFPLLLPSLALWHLVVLWGKWKLKVTGHIFIKYTCLLWNQCCRIMVGLMGLYITTSHCSNVTKDMMFKSYFIVMMMMTV